LPESEKRRFSRPRDISKSTADFDETKLKTKSPQLVDGQTVPLGLFWCVVDPHPLASAHSL